MSGPVSVQTGVPNTWSASITGGVSPYRAKWICQSGTCPFTVPADPAQYGDPGANLSVTHTFSDVESDVIQLQIWDSAGSTASAMLRVAVGGYQQEYMGELWKYDVSHYGFVVYTKAQDVSGSFMKWDGAPIYTPVGSDPVPYAFAAMVQTCNYSVVQFSPVQIYSDCYVLDAASVGTASGTVLSVRIVDAVNGTTKVVEFSFDCSVLSNLGAWVKSDGQSGTVLAGGPDWLDALLNAMMKMFRWLFVPSQAQLQSVFPSGALDGGVFLPFGSLTAGSDDTWIVKGHYAGREITFIKMDLSVVPESVWTMCRTIVGALVGISEIILLVSLL